MTAPGLNNSDTSGEKSLSLGRATSFILNVTYVAINTAILVFSKSLAEQANHLSSGLIPMVRPKSYFKVTSEYASLVHAENSRKAVEILCWKIGFWSPISCSLLIASVFVLCFGIFNKSINVLQFTTFIAGGIIAFWATTHFMSALLALPQMSFESY